MKRDISIYFKQFGTIESVRTHTKLDSSFAFVQFKDSAGAAAALAKRQHKVSNRTIIVKAANRQPDPQSTTPEQDSKSHILIALNDDCLQEVFKFLTEFDLTNVANTCVRFQTQAIETFKSKYKHLTLRPDSASRGVNKSVLFMIFGSLIQSLEIVDDELDVPEMQLIIEKCTQLKALTLSDDKLQKVGAELRTLFGRLESLTLANMFMDSCPNDLLVNCLNLRKLEIKDCWNLNHLINQNFPNLEETIISNAIIEGTALDLRGFIASNPLLVKLCIKRDYHGNDLQWLRLIGQTMINLQSLELSWFNGEEQQFQTHAEGLGNLHLLTVLKLNFSGALIEPLARSLAANKVPIQHLAIRSGKINEHAINQVGQLERLEVLELLHLYDLTDEYLKAFAKGLPKLRELHLEGSGSELSTIGLKKMLKEANQLSLLTLKSIETIAFDVDDYKEILGTVQKRTEKVRFVIEITSRYGDKVNVPEEVLNENREICFINEKIEERDNETISNDSNELDHDDYDYDIDYDDEDDFSGHEFMYDYDSADEYDHDLDDVGFVDGQPFFLG